MTESHKVLDKQGYTSIVYSLPGTPPRVCKAFNADRIEDLYPVERAAYERFVSHDHPPSILKYYGVHPEIPAGLILGLAEKGNVLEYLWNQTQRGHPRPSDEVLCRWARQAAEALEFAHSVGVMNSDIHCINFFLDQDLNLKVGDWAGASIDGSRSRSSYRLRHVLFDTSGFQVARSTGITVHTEIFALGTALYYMIASQNLWPELREPADAAEIKQRLARQDFPDTGELPVLGDVVRKCWHVEFESMTEVRVAVEAEERLNASSVLREALPSSWKGESTTQRQEQRTSAKNT